MITNTQNQEAFDNKLLTPIEQKIDAALVSHVYKQANFSFVASLLGATISVIALYNSQAHGLLFGWYLVFLLVTLARYLLVRKFLQQLAPEKHFTLWRNLYIFGAILGGLSWGFLVSFLLPYQNAMELTVIIVVIAGVTGGAALVLSGILTAAITYSVCVLLPLAIRLFFVSENAPIILLETAVLIYLVYIIIFTIKTNRIISYSIGLQFENDQLLNHLTDAKQELEITNKKLQHAATHDPLTNLANRNLFETEFSAMLLRAEQEKKVLAVFYLDIDNFKNVNDMYGHHIGDLLLQQIVERVKFKLPEKHIIARLGGDEITIVIEGFTNPDKLAEIAQQICESFTVPFNVKDCSILVGISIGISIYPIDGRDTEMVLKNADKAMYYIKERQGNSFHFYTDLITLRTMLKKIITDSELHF